MQALLPSRILSADCICGVLDADPVAESKLITAAAPNATSKHKTLQLFNPDAVVEFKYTGTISFKWAFKWEEWVILRHNAMREMLMRLLAMTLNGGGRNATCCANLTLPSW